MVGKQPKCLDLQDVYAVSYTHLLAGECDLLTMMLQSAGASLFNEDGTTNIAKNDTLKKVIDTYCKMKDSGVLQEVNNWDEYTGTMLNSEVAGVINGCWIMGCLLYTSRCV